MSEHEEYFAQLELQRIVFRNAKRQLWTALLAVVCMVSGLLLIAWKVMEVWRW